MEETELMSTKQDKTFLSIILQIWNGKYVSYLRQDRLVDSYCLKSLVEKKPSSYPGLVGKRVTTVQQGLQGAPGRAADCMVALTPSSRGLLITLKERTASQPKITGFRVRFCLHVSSTTYF